jgi:hypothetical protein
MESGGRATIHIRREPGGLADRSRAYRVVLDGHEVGKLRRGERITLDVDPGRHEVYLKIDWARSPTIAVELAPKEEPRLVCAPGASPVTFLYYITFGRDRYIKLDRFGAIGVGVFDASTPAYPSR